MDAEDGEIKRRGGRPTSILGSCQFTPYRPMSERTKKRMSRAHKKRWEKRKRLMKLALPKISPEEKRRLDNIRKALLSLKSIGTELEKRL